MTGSAIQQKVPKQKRNKKRLQFVFIFLAPCRTFLVDFKEHTAILIKKIKHNWAIPSSLVDPDPYYLSEFQRNFNNKNLTSYENLWFTLYLTTYFFK